MKNVKLNNKAKHHVKVNERTLKVRHRTGDQCPSCVNGKLLKREGRFGIFLGCSNFPRCRYVKNIRYDKIEMPVIVSKSKLNNNYK